MRSSIQLGTEAKQKLLQSSFIFGDLTPDLLEKLARLTNTKHLDKGAMLFQQGDDGDALYGVVEGLVRISVTGDLGKELTLGLMEPGDVFGEIAVLDGLPRTANASAATDCTLLVLERSHFLPVLAEDRRLSRHLIELLCERLRNNTDRLSEYAFLSLSARLARKLEALAIAHGREEGSSIRIELKLPQSELAQMLGVTREAVNKQLKHWSREGVIQLDRGYITINALDRLAAQCRPAAR